MKRVIKAAVMGMTCFGLTVSAMGGVLGVNPGYPRIDFADPTPALAYDPVTQTFTINGAPVSLMMNSADWGSFFYGTPSLVVTAHVDNSGNLVPGTGGTDLVMSGTVDVDVTGTGNYVTYDGVLLTGTAAGFGYLDIGATDEFEFRFAITGGQLQSLFACGTIGVSGIADTITSENSTFTNSFKVAFTGGSKGYFGPEDFIAPAINCPPDNSVALTPATDANGNKGYILTYSNPTATDNCDPNPRIICVPPSGTFVGLAPGETTNVTCYAVDSTGNSSSCSFTATAPQANGPIDFVGGPCDPTTLNNDPGKCSATYFFPPLMATNGNGQVFPGTATAVDQYGVVIPLSLVNGQYAGQFPHTTFGTNIITFTANDGQGNTAVRQCEVFVLDREAPTILCQAQTSTFKPAFATASSCLYGEFNCNAIDKDNIIWFSSVLNTPSKCDSPFAVRVFNQTIQMVVDGQAPITIPVPDSYVTISPNATQATTTFSNGVWTTVAPANASGSIFMSGAAYQVLANIIGCQASGHCSLYCCRCPRPPKVQKTKVTWCASFELNKPDIIVNWQWAAAVYSQFSADYNALRVKPTDSRVASAYKDIYDAGTPENFKACWVPGGARGDRYNRCGDRDTYVGEPTRNTRVNLGTGIVCKGPVSFKNPQAFDNCDGPVAVTCDPPSGSLFGPGDHPITCTAHDSSGNMSTCTFTLTVLAPLQVVFDNPSCDNLNDNVWLPDAGFTDFNCPDSSSTLAIINRFCVGSKILHKVRLLDCNGNDVTACVAPSVTVHIDVTERQGDYSNGTLVKDLPVNFSCIGSAGGLMVPICGTFQYNLDTKGYEAGTINSSRFFRSCVWVDYNSSPGIPVGMEDVLLESNAQ